MGLQTNQVTSLKDISAAMLPARVLVPLSKYVVLVKKHDDVIVQTSSLNVFAHIDNANKRTRHPEVRLAYYILLRRVNQCLQDGTMRTNEQHQQVTELQHKHQQATELQHKPEHTDDNRIRVAV